MKTFSQRLKQVIKNKRTTLKKSRAARARLKLSMMRLKQKIGDNDHE